MTVGSGGPGQLQEAIVELVIEQGYESISIDALASRADVTRATFYAHYRSKNDLLTAVVDSFADGVEEALRAHDIAPRNGGRLAVLLGLAREWRDVIGLIVRGEGDGGPLRRLTERVEQVLAADLAREGASTGVDPGLLVKVRAAAVNQLGEHGWRGATSIPTAAR